MVTIEEVFRLALPEGTRLIGGAAGLGREVSWAVSLRATSPGFAALKGGELAIISLPVLRLLDEHLTLAHAVRQLAEKGVAGVAVEGEAGDPAVQVAEHLGLPLLLLPPGASRHDVERATTRFIVDRQAELYRRSEEVRRHLTELAIDGRGDTAIAEALARITGLAVAIENAEGELLFCVPAPALALDEERIKKELHDTQARLRQGLPTEVPCVSDPPAIKMALGEPSLARVTAPIGGQDGVEGYLSLLGPRDCLWEAERTAVARGAAACAIEVSRRRAAFEAQDRLQLHFLDDVLGGQFGLEEDLRERARRLGYDLTIPYLVLALGMGTNGLSSHGPSPSAAIRDLTKAIRTELSRRGVNALLRVMRDKLIILYPASAISAGGNVKKLAKELIGDSGFAASGIGVSVGVGGSHDGVKGIRLAYEEAVQALSIGNRLFGSGHVTAFGDLGLYRLLFGIRNTEELRSFHQQMLGKLIEYDAKNGAELVKTLDAYFASGNSPTSAADLLHLHRNTLLYRLQRIGDITGLDLDDPETRLSLHLALRIGDVLAEAPNNSATPAPRVEQVAKRSG